MPNYRLDIYRVRPDTDTWPVVDTIRAESEEACRHEADRRYPNSEDRLGSLHWTTAKIVTED